MRGCVCVSGWFQGSLRGGWWAEGATCSSPFPGKTKPKQPPKPWRPHTSLCLPTLPGFFHPPNMGAIPQAFQQAAGTASVVQ